MVKVFDEGIRAWNVRKILHFSALRVLRLATHSRICFYQKEMLRQGRPS
jgi:hypothetical protein